MNFVYQTQGIEFEWDINKAESNFFKHGVRFEEAVSCCAFRGCLKSF